MFAIATLLLLSNRNKQQSLHTVANQINKEDKNICEEPQNIEAQQTTLVSRLMKTIKKLGGQDKQEDRTNT